MDPISILGSAGPVLGGSFTAINSIYHLRLELKNTPEYIQDIRSNLDNLETKINDLRRLSGPWLASKDNRKIRAKKYAAFIKKIKKIDHLLSTYQKNGGGSIGALVFRFGPKAESKAMIKALHTIAKELVQAYKRIHLSYTQLSRRFPQRGEPQTADNKTIQLLFDQIYESLASAAPDS